MDSFAPRRRLAGSQNIGTLPYRNLFVKPLVILMEARVTWWWIGCALVGLMSFARPLHGGEVPILRFVQASVGLPDSIPPGGGWTGLAFGDVDGDGRSDLAAIARKGDGPHVFLHKEGIWREASRGLLRHFSGRSGVRFADINGDGRLDLVTSGGEVFLGDGKGSWTLTAQLPFEGEDVAIGDVNHDDRPDLAIIGHLAGGIRVFIQDGRGGWNEASQGLPTQEGGHKLIYADMNKDGHLDLVGTVTYVLGVWLGDGKGNWRKAVEGLPRANCWGAAVDDLDRDGNLDLVVGCSDPQGVHIFLGDGTGSWRHLAAKDLPRSGMYMDVALVDFNGDGRLDLVTGRFDGRIQVFFGDGKGGFTEIQVVGLPPKVGRPETLVVGDQDGDGFIDLGIAAYQGRVQVWRTVGSVQH